MVFDAEVTRSLDALRAAHLTTGELRASLQTVADATCALFDADGAGVMLLDEQQALHYVSSTSNEAAALEAAQEETGEGPCVDSIIFDEVVMTSDVMTDRRWPRLRQAATDMGVGAVMGAPIRLGGTAVGSLNTYRVERYRWTSRDIDAITAHGRVVEELIGAALLAGQRNEIVDQLNRALESRVTIERAIGVVMGRDGVDPVRAFDRLRRVARSERRKVSEVAQDVLADDAYSPPTVIPVGGEEQK